MASLSDKFNNGVNGTTTAQPSVAGVYNPNASISPTLPIKNEDQFILDLKKQIKEVNSFIQDKALHLRNLSDGTDIECTVKVYFDMTSLENAIRHDVAMKMPNKVVDCWNQNGKKMPIFSNQICTAMPHLINILTKTNQGSESRIFKLNDELVQEVAKVAGMTVDEYYKTPAEQIWAGREHLKQETICKENMDIVNKTSHGLFNEYEGCDTWEREFPHNIIVGSAQGGKTGVLIATFMNDWIANFVFADYVFTDNPKQRAFHAMPLLPRRKEIMGNFEKDLNYFLEIWGDVEVVVSYFDKTGLRQTSAKLSQLKTKSEAYVKATLVANYENMNKAATDQILPTMTEEEKQKIAEQKEIFEDLYGWLCGNKEKEEKIYAHFEVDPKNHINPSAQANVRQSKEYFTMIAKMAEKSFLIIDFHTDEGHFGAGPNSVLYQILHQSGMGFDNSNSFITTITWTPDMFRHDENVYWIFFRFPDNTEYHGLTGWNGSCLHHNPHMAITPNIMSWEDWCQLPHINLPNLVHLDWTSIVDKTDFDNKRFNHQFGNTHKTDQSISNFLLEEAYLAGMPGYGPLTKTAPYPRFDKDFNTFTDHDEYSKAMLNDLALAPFRVFENALQTGTDRIIDPITNENQRIAATIKIHSKKRFEQTSFKKNLEDYAKDFESTHGIKVHVIFSDSNAKGSHLSFYDYYNSLCLPASFKPRPGTEGNYADKIKADDFVIFVITGSWRMAVRIPARCQFALDTAIYNDDKPATDSYLQGLAPRHWGYKKGRPVAVVSPSAALFFEIYNYSKGKHGVLPKHTKIIDSSSKVAKLDRYGINIPFDECLQIARDGGFTDVVTALTDLNSNVQQHVRPATGQRLPLRNNVKKSKEAFAILSNSNYLVALANKMNTGFKFLELNESVPMLRHGTVYNMPYDVDIDKVTIQCRWGWLITKDALSNQFGGDKKSAPRTTLSLTIKTDNAPNPSITDIRFALNHLNPRTVTRTNVDDRLFAPKSRTVPSTLLSERQNREIAGLANQPVRVNPEQPQHSFR